MKKFIVSLILFAGMMIGAQAQEQNDNRHGQRNFDPEKMAQMHAQRTAESLSLNEEESAAFIPMYIEYSKEFREVNQKYRLQRVDREKFSDADADALIRNNFKKSRAILDLREAWYEKFLAVLSPMQLHKMFEQENNMGKSAAEMHARGGQPNGQPNGQFNGQFNGHRGQHGNRPSVEPKPTQEQN